MLPAYGVADVVADGSAARRRRATARYATARRRGALRARHVSRRTICARACARRGTRGVLSAAPRTAAPRAPAFHERGDAILLSMLRVAAAEAKHAKMDP